MQICVGALMEKAFDTCCTRTVFVSPAGGRLRRRQSTPATFAKGARRWRWVVIPPAAPRHAEGTLVHWRWWASSCPPPTRIIRSLCARPAFLPQQDIAGEHTDYINDAELRNAPDVHAWRRGGGVPILLLTGIVFQRVDKEPAQRQLYQIAELGKPANEPTRTPKYMRLLVATEQPRIAGDALDFRDEVMAQIFDPGDAAPKRPLTFNIEVTGEGSAHGPGISQHVTFSNWRRIGNLTLDNGVVSYNGDFVIHFNHPTWRTDRNDPSTATRVNEHKVG